MKRVIVGLVVTVGLLAGCAPLVGHRVIYRDPQTGREFACEQQESGDMVSTMERRGGYIDCKNKMEERGYVRVKP